MLCSSLSQSVSLLSLNLVQDPFKRSLICCFSPTLYISSYLLQQQGPHLSISPLSLSSFFPHSLSLIHQKLKPASMCVFLRMNISCNKRLLLLTAVAVLLFHGGDASRTINTYKIRSEPPPNSDSGGHFLNFMPKRWIPASAPSRKHNDLGLQNWRFPWTFLFPMYILFSFFISSLQALPYFA